MLPASLVSVIIPCYNLGQYLDEAVDSVLAQTYQDFEILIVDDGSTDPFTAELLRNYDRPKTTVFRTPNRKLAAARNFLIQHAQGVYLCALDADDKLDPQYLEKTVAVLDAEPSLGFVSTHLRMFGAESRVWPDVARCDLPMLLVEDTVTTAALVRRSAVLAVGGYDEGMPHQGDEDWDLWISLVAAGHPGVILPDILFHYRRRPGSMCDECTSAPIHLELVEYLVRKHAGAYRAHWREVMRLKEALISELRSANVALEMELATSLEPTVGLRRAELAGLKERLDQARSARTTAGSAAASGHELAALADARAAYRTAQAEVEALRSSASWRITAPLRALYGMTLGGHRDGA